MDRELFYFCLFLIPFALKKINLKSICPNVVFLRRNNIGILKTRVTLSKITSAYIDAWCSIQKKKKKVWRVRMQMSENRGLLKKVSRDMLVDGRRYVDIHCSHSSEYFRVLGKFFLFSFLLRGRRWYENAYFIKVNAALKNMTIFWKFRLNLFSRLSWLRQCDREINRKR